MFCCYQRQLTKDEESKRLYNQAKEIVKRIYADKVGNNFTCMQIVLDENYVCIVNVIGDIVGYNWAKKEKI